MRICSRQSAFSLIEFVVALFLAGLVVYVGLTSLPHLWIAGQRGNDALAASATMQTAIETLRARPFTELELTDWQPLEVKPAVEDFEIQLRYRVTAASDPNLDTDQARLVEVEGRWGDARRQRLETRKLRVFP